MTEADLTDWTVFGNTLYLGTPGRVYVAFPGDAASAQTVASAHNALLKKHQQLQARLDGLNLAATQYSESRDRWYSAAQQAEAQAALYRGTIDSAAKLLRARPIKTAFDDDVIRALEHTLAERDAGAVLLAELEAARALIGTLREVLAGETSRSALTVAMAQYDEAAKERQCD